MTYQKEVLITFFLTIHILINPLLFSIDFKLYQALILLLKTIFRRRMELRLIGVTIIKLRMHTQAKVYIKKSKKGKMVLRNKRLKQEVLTLR
jgi:hypothetical protein